MERTIGKRRKRSSDCESEEPVKQVRKIVGVVSVHFLQYVGQMASFHRIEKITDVHSKIDAVQKVYRLIMSVESGHMHQDIELLKKMQISDLRSLMFFRGASRNIDLDSARKVYDVIYVYCYGRITKAKFDDLMKSDFEEGQQMVSDSTLYPDISKLPKKMHVLNNERAFQHYISILQGKFPHLEGMYSSWKLWVQGIAEGQANENTIPLIIEHLFENRGAAEEKKDEFKNNVQQILPVINCLRDMTSDLIGLMMNFNQTVQHLHHSMQVLGKSMQDHLDEIANESASEERSSQGNRT